MGHNSDANKPKSAVFSWWENPQNVLAAVIVLLILVLSGSILFSNRLGTKETGNPPTPVQSPENEYLSAYLTFLDASQGPDSPTGTDSLEKVLPKDYDAVIGWKFVSAKNIDVETGVAVCWTVKRPSGAQQTWLHFQLPDGVAYQSRGQETCQQVSKDLKLDSSTSILYADFLGVLDSYPRELLTSHTYSQYQLLLESLQESLNPPSPEPSPTL